MIFHPNDVTFSCFHKKRCKGTTKNAHTQIFDKKSVFFDLLSLVKGADDSRSYLRLT